MSTRTNEKLNHDSSCPYCKASIGDPAELARAEKAFTADVTRRIRDETRKKDIELRETVRELKEVHRREVQDLRKRSMEDKRQLKEKSIASSGKERNTHKSEMAKLRKSHQDQLEKARDIYERENLRMQKEQESSFNAQLREIIQNYGNLASAHQKELERLKKIQDERDGLVQKKDAEISRLRIELAQSSSKLEVKELMIQLHERNATIEKLNSRIEELELENKLGVQQRPPSAANQAVKTMTDEEQREKLKEYMRAIIEITRNQRAEKKRSELSGQGAESADEFTEKSNKLLGWFL